MDSTFSTICSLLPYQLTELKPGLTPNEYIVAKAPENGFSLNIIPNNVHYLVNPDPLADAKESRNIKVPVLSIELAQSIINDYNSSLLGVSPPDCLPGLFAVSGDWKDKKDFAIKFNQDIAAYRIYQNNWFRNLVDIADDIWSKSHSPVSVSDLQRFACRALGYERDWLNPIPTEQIEKCPICKSPINTGALKCVVCQHIINKAEYDRVMLAVK